MKYLHSLLCYLFAETLLNCEKIQFAIKHKYRKKWQSEFCSSFIYFYFIINFFFHFFCSFLLLGSIPINDEKLLV